MSTLVFLHVPKTAGQTVHNELQRAVGGAAHVSPVRVTAQAVGGRQMPDGYRLYSGHIDWTEVELLPADRFVFTILRDPKERIASFYLYMRKQAKLATPEALLRPENIGKRMALDLSADDYFFGGPPDWHRFVRSMYDNFYCSYFASRQMDGWHRLKCLPKDERLARALTGLASLSAVYRIEGLDQLECDIRALYGVEIRLTGNYFNTGGHIANESRWSKLCARFEKDRSIARLAEFTALDDLVMQQVFSGEPSSLIDDLSVKAS